MVHRGKRSLNAEARRYIIKQSFLDIFKAETVNRVTRANLVRHLTDFYEIIDYSKLMDVVQGEILVDSRGQGSFQI